MARKSAEAEVGRKAPKSPKSPVTTATGTPVKRARVALEAPRRERRKQETRTREARDRLLAATIEVLMQRGYAGLTTKEVAATAQLSNGALMHHFATKAELVVAATEAVYAVALERGARTAASPDAKAHPLEGFIDDSIDVYLDWPFLVALEVIIVARTDAELMSRVTPVMEHYRQETNARWLAVFEAAGMTSPDAQRVLDLTLNLVRGIAVNQLWHADIAYCRAQIADWKQIILAHLASAARIERKRAGP